MNNNQPTVRLENWSLLQGLYVANNRLRGNVYGHPDKEDGKQIDTSTIRSVRGRAVTTASETVYILEEPDIEWVAWLEKNKIKYNHTNPLGYQYNVSFWRKLLNALHIK